MGMKSRSNMDECARYHNNFRWSKYWMTHIIEPSLPELSWRFWKVTCHPTHPSTQSSWVAQPLWMSLTNLPKTRVCQTCNVPIIFGNNTSKTARFTRIRIQQAMSSSRGHQQLADGLNFWLISVTTISQYYHGLSWLRVNHSQRCTAQTRWFCSH